VAELSARGVGGRRAQAMQNGFVVRYLLPCDAKAREVQLFMIVFIFHCQYPASKKNETVPVEARSHYAAAVRRLLQSFLAWL
jgi:hypothetical protein